MQDNHNIALSRTRGQVFVTCQYLDVYLSSVDIEIFVIQLFNSVRVNDMQIQKVKGGIIMLVLHEQ